MNNNNTEYVSPPEVPSASVLIVDDNPINQTILSTFMKRYKIKYDVAQNGKEAVEKWETGEFHLIVMDIQMPVMNGIEATQTIRNLENARSAYGSSVIIVALVASPLESDRTAALAAGCNDILTKPVSLQVLRNKLIEYGVVN